MEEGKGRNRIRCTDKERGREKKSVRKGGRGNDARGMMLDKTGQKVWKGRERDHRLYLSLHEPTPSLNRRRGRATQALIKVRVQHGPDVLRRSEVRQEGDQVGEFGVVRVVEPRRDRDGVVRVEDVGGGRVVDDDRVFHGATELGEVLCGEKGGGKRQD